MEHIKNTIRKINNVINDNIHNPINNDNNGGKKFALDERKFKLNTPEAQLAKDIAEYFNDLANYAFYFSVVKRLRRDRAYMFWQSVKGEIAEKEHDELYKIRDPKRYFAWRYKEGLIP